MKVATFFIFICTLSISLRTCDLQTVRDCEVCVPYYQCSENNLLITDGTTLIDLRMRKTGPCKGSLDVCCRRNEVTNVKPTQPIQPTSSSCGTRNIYGVGSLRITGARDNEAQFGEFPWMVAVVQRINDRDIFVCGGSLLSLEVVLTAAHCVTGKTQLAVRAGEWDTKTMNEPLPSQTRQVREVLVHEQFNARKLHNDVALLLLKTPLNPADNVGTICLPEQDEVMDNRHCVASGWGKDQFGDEGVYQTILKKVELPIVSKSACLAALRTTRLGDSYKLHESFICAGGIPGKDTCKGDGGGPLACPSSRDSQVYVQAGIVAGGVGCNTETPGVYVDVAHFRNWIDNQLGAFSSITSQRKGVFQNRS